MPFEFLIKGEIYFFFQITMAFLLDSLPDYYLPPEDKIIFQETILVIHSHIEKFVLTFHLVCIYELKVSRTIKNGLVGF